MRIQCLSGCHCKKLNLTCNYASPWSTRLWLYSVMGGRGDEGGERGRGEGRKERAERRIEGRGRTKKGDNVVLKWVNVIMVTTCFHGNGAMKLLYFCYLSKCILQKSQANIVWISQCHMLQPPFHGCR